MHVTVLSNGILLKGIRMRQLDARAATVMAPTTDALYDFIGKAVCGMPVFG